MKKSYCSVCKKYFDNGRFCGVCGSTLQTVEIPEESHDSAWSSTVTLMAEPDAVSLPVNNTVDYDMRSSIPSTTSQAVNVPQSQPNHEISAQNNFSSMGAPDLPVPLNQGGMNTTNMQNMPQAPAFGTNPVQNVFAGREAPDTPLKSGNKKLRFDILTIVGLVLLAIYVFVTFIMAMGDASDNIEEYENVNYGISVNVSRFWFFLIFGISLALLAAAVLGNKVFSITGVSLFFALIAFTIIMALITEKGYHGISFNLDSTSIYLDMNSEFSKALAYNTYGMAMLKMMIFWIASLVLIIIGRIKEGKKNF